MTRGKFLMYFLPSLTISHINVTFFFWIHRRAFENATKDSIKLNIGYFTQYWSKTFSSQPDNRQYSLDHITHGATFKVVLLIEGLWCKQSQKSYKVGYLRFGAYCQSVQGQTVRIYSLITKLWYIIGVFLRLIQNPVIGDQQWLGIMQNLCGCETTVTS